MKTNRLIFLIVFSIILMSCNFKPRKFRIEQQVKNYVRNVQKIKSKNNLLFIFITGFATECRPCEESTMALVDSIFKFKRLSDFSKYIVISDNNEDAYNKFIPSRCFTVLTDSKYVLQKHGIDESFNFIIEFNSDFETIYWESLGSATFSKIYENYKEEQD